MTLQNYTEIVQKQTKIRNVFDLKTFDFKRVLSFGHYRYNKVEPILEVHNHNQVLEFCYFIKGKQFYTVGEQSFQLTGNDIIIIPPNVDHSSGIYPEDIGELFWLQISLKEEDGRLCNLSKEHTNHLLQQLGTKANYKFKGAIGLKIVLEKVMVLLKKDRTLFGDIQLQQLIVQLLIKTLILSNKPQSIINTDKIKIINEYINKNLYKPIYVDELSDLIGISTAYFKTWFKTKCGMPPKAYVNRIKIDQAKRDLPNKRNISQVAYDLGFSSSQYFSTSFKKHTGMTPNTYLKIFTENNNLKYNNLTTKVLTEIQNNYNQ